MNMLDRYWALYSLTMHDIRAEKPDTFPKLAAILNRFQHRSAGDAFFPASADDVLGDALDDAGWHLTCEAHYLWTAVHPVTRTRIHFIEGDVYDETSNQGGKR